MHLSYGLRLPTDARHVPVVRRLTTSTLTELGVDRDSIDDIALAVTEACSNVVRHAGADGDFEVRVAVEGATCTIEVVDSGPGALRGGAAADAPEDGEVDGGADGEVDGEGLLTHGRGLSLMRLLVDAMHFTPGEGGTTVVLVKSLRVRAGSVLADQLEAGAATT